MANEISAFQPAIDALEEDLAEVERQGNALLTSINILRAKVGLPPRPGTFGAGPGDSATASAPPLALRSDSFVGSKMGAAARTYLEMRKAGGGDSPATVREIFAAMKQGGFDFRSKDDSNAIIVLRAMLRKRSAVFHKMPNGKYGLKAWYGSNLRSPKDAAAPKNEGGETRPLPVLNDDETETAEADEASAA